MNILYLIKFVGEKEYAEQFINGELYFNRLSFFKRIEENDDEGRKDSNEAISYWWQKNKIQIDISTPSLGKSTILDKDLVAPVKVSFLKDESLHIFCLYAMRTNGFELIDGKIEYLKEEAIKSKTQLMIDDRCFKFGRYAVIVPAKQFIELISASLESTGKKCRARLVEYFDGDSFHGEFERFEVPFNKEKHYSYQSEYRICIDNRTQGSDPFILSIGSLKDISTLVESSELNNIFKTNSIEV